MDHAVVQLSEVSLIAARSTGATLVEARAPFRNEEAVSDMVSLWLDGFESGSQDRAQARVQEARDDRRRLRVTEVRASASDPLLERATRAAKDIAQKLEDVGDRARKLNRSVSDQAVYLSQCQGISSRGKRIRASFAKLHGDTADEDSHTDVNDEANIVVAGGRCGTSEATESEVRAGVGGDQQGEGESESGMHRLRRVI